MSKLRLSYSSSSPISPVVLAMMLAFVTPDLSAQSSTVFNGPRNYQVGTLTFNFDKTAVADFNGDGRPDIAVANNGSNNVSVLLQNSDGTFQPAVNYSVGNQPFSVQAGDINGDGQQDLVVVNSGDNALGVLLGNGDGTFQAQLTTALPVTTPSSSFYPFMVLGDWNGDGKTDVAIAGALPQAGSYAIAVMLSKGDGTFQTPVTYSLTAAPFAFSVGDFNRDGKLDLVTSGRAGVSTWLGNGDGTFKAAITTASSQQLVQGAPLVIADFNQDGHLDVATATDGTEADETVENLTLFLGNGDGTFQVQILPAFLVQPSAAGDLNGDGKPDLIAAGPSPMEVTILLNSGNGTFTAGPSIDLWPTSVNSAPTAITLADLNGDQKLDLVSGLNGAEEPSLVSVLYGNGDGSFAQFPSYGATTSQTSGVVVAADFNNDGKPDLATAFVGPSGYSNIRLLLNDGAGFSPPIDTAIGIFQGPVSSIAAGDFNGDGKMDAVMAIAYPSSGIFALLGNGNGTFRTAVEYGQQITGPLVVGDFNGDGKLDILGVTASNPGAGVSVLLGKGDGTFGFPVNTLTTISGDSVVAQAIAVADFNGDGKLDVAALVLNNDTTAPQQLLILLGNGDGTFTVGPTYNAGANPASIAIGDLNGDGNPDLVVGNAYQGLGTITESGVAVLLGNGDGTFQAPIITSAGNGNYSVAVADFNLDGKADVILSDSPWSDISLLLGNGDGTFQPPMQFFLGNSLWSFTPRSIFAVTDFDGNGTPDLAVAGTNGISVLLNAAGSHAPSPLLSTGTLAFGSVHMGQPVSQTATLTNMATSALTISGISISGAQSAGFSQTNSCGTSLAAGLSCTINVTFAPQATGARTATVQIADNASNSPQMISLSGTGLAAPSIGLGVPSGASSSATVTAGQPASYTLSIGGADMSGTTSLTCTGAPQGATCSVPSSVMISGTTASTVKVSVTTTSRTTASMNSRWPIPFGGAWAAILFGLVLLPTPWKKRGSKGIFLGALIVSLALISSCGGGPSTGTTTNQHGTPAGTYSLTVSATLNSVTETTTLKLVVQ